MPFKKGEGVNPRTAHSSFARAGREKNAIDNNRRNGEKRKKNKKEAAAVTAATVGAACVGVAGDIRSDGAALRTATALAWRVRVQKLIIFLPLFPSCIISSAAKKSCLRTNYCTISFKADREYKFFASKQKKYHISPVYKVCNIQFFFF